MKEKLIYGMILLVVMTGCTTPYEPEGVTWTKDLLVVEATLQAPYGSTVKISRTIPLDDWAYHPVNAAVKILSDDGQVYRMTEKTPGTYGFDQAFEYRDKVKYALDIVCNGKQYQSAYMAPLRTPEISALTHVYSEKYERMDINVSVENPNVDVAYYRWEYKENWEIIAPAYANYGWDPVVGLSSEYSLFNAHNTYYCWGNSQSNHFILGSSERQTTSALRDVTIQHIPRGSDKVGYLYHIGVKQYAIPKEAYVYFRNLQNNVEETGSLFAPQPTEMKGNIVCLDKAEEVVIGFFVATTEASKEMYINALDIPEMKKDKYDCMDDPVTGYNDPQEAFKEEYYIYFYDPTGEIPASYLPKRCVDCTARGGTKERPSWWANDHY